MLRPVLLPLAAGLALLAGGCGGGGDGDYEPEVRENEKRIGAEQHPQLLAEFGGEYRAPEADYARRVGEKIAAAAGLEGECTFTLVNSDVVNAFAVPGCYIYVTRGLMGIVNSEAELASVLAHEVGHIVAAHNRRQQRRSLLRSIGVWAVGALGSEDLSRIAGRAAEYFTLRYSRKQEYEADDLGVRYLAAAGYDPYAAGDMLDALGRHEQYMGKTRGRDEARAIPEWARTHPLAGNRIERAAQSAAATGIADGALPELEAPYLRELDGLLYGDDPAQGFVDGRRFAHPVMRIGFEAPHGFTLTNSPQAILIEGPEGLRGEFGGGPMPPGGLAAYSEGLIRTLLRGTPAEAGSARPVRINGLPALLVPVLVRTEQGAVELNIAAYDGGGGGAYHFIMVAPPADSSRAAIGALFASFRLLSPEEARSLRPRLIRTVRVGPGQTAATFASAMASEHPLDHFLMLNGRSPGQALKPGELVKIITFAPVAAGPE
ncbi:MAG TPA: M48 family metalloprotease [Allosphingosinicella sp.]|nr:M48 family metalloprotease [Allosphingosinicella sp.]